MGETATVHIEVEAVQDACAELVKAHRALASRRGPIYRRLEHDIEEQSAAILQMDVVIHPLGDGFYAAAAPDELVGLLRRARALRLLRP